MHESTHFSIIWLEKKKQSEVKLTKFNGRWDIFQIQILYFICFSSKISLKKSSSERLNNKSARVKQTKEKIWKDFIWKMSCYVCMNFVNKTFELLVYENQRLIKLCMKFVKAAMSYFLMSGEQWKLDRT